ncbi:MAG: DsrE family protein [Desulfobacterales bacterium]|nr:DsrE family protein [Desulfobacterales bacterium]
MGKYLIIANSGPEDANRATVPFLTAKALVEKGHEVSIWLYNNAVYLLPEGVPINIQAPGLPNLEDLLLFLTMTKNIPIYIGVSCAIGRGLVSEEHEIICSFTCGELGNPSQLADLIVEADNVIGF